MPTDIEIRVMKILTAIELTPASAETIKAMGNEAVTVVTEAALGTYPGLRPKVRTNAVGLLGWIDHPQATETLALLVHDPNPDIAIRAIRAAGRQRSEDAVGKLAQILTNPAATPILAAEAAKALHAIGSPQAMTTLTAYEAASPNQYPHRGSAVVRDVLAKRRTM
jgi:HEAT repeat protein